MATATNEAATAQANRGQRLTWWVPRWSAARESRKLAPTLFAAGPVLRITLVSILVGAAILRGAKIAWPQLQLDFVWRALWAIPGMFAYVGLMLLLNLAIPGHVTITAKHVTHGTGQSAWRAKLTEIESSRLIIYSPDHLQLVIRARGTRRKMALPSTVDLDQLLSLLDNTDVIDKRRQLIAARKLARASKSS